MRSYVHLLKELNKRLPEGIELLTLVNYDLGPNGAPIKLLLLNRNHPDKISDLERLVSATGYGKTNEFEYDSEFVFFEQGMGITIDYYSFYKLKNNTITNIKKDLNKEYEKMEILLRIYEFKMI